MKLAWDDKNQEWYLPMAAIEATSRSQTLNPAMLTYFMGQKLHCIMDKVTGQLFGQRFRSRASRALHSCFFADC
jgi:hypothetical protein